jgi:hypothetical protein
VLIKTYKNETNKKNAQIKKKEKKKKKKKTRACKIINQNKATRHKKKQTTVTFKLFWQE